MSILTWIEDKKRLKVLNAPKHSIGSTDSSKGLWTRCDKCGVILYIEHLKENQRVCFSCSYHLQMMSGERIENLLDKSSANALPFSKENNQRSKSGISPSLLSQSESGNQSFLKKKGHFSQQKQDTNVRKSDSLEPFFVSSAKAKKKGNATYFSTWRPLDETVSPCDPLKFHDQKAYTDRLQDAQERTGLQDAIQTGTGMIDGIPVALAVMDFSFMGGSMGSVVGEKITRLIEYATGEGLTLLIVSASGGARMQEGVFSLMQMAKISSALQIYQSCAKLLYISILTSPTTGGVTASFAMLGDIIFAEPKALIAFAGRRVIEQTLCEDLPDDFQTSEYMLHHGLVDLIVPRRFLRQALSETIRLYQNAPFKKRGQIPFGVQNPITFLTEEKIRRSWGSLTSPSTKAMSYPENNYSYNQNKIVSQQELERRSLTKTSKKSSEKSELFKAKLGSLEPGFSSFCDANKAITNLKFVRGHTNLREPTKLRFEGQASARKSSPTFFYNENEISAKATRAFKEPAFSNQGTNFPLRVTKQSFVTPGFSNPKQIYREILTSFEIMLALFISGNSKKQNQASLRLQKTTYNKSSRDFLSEKIKAPFWVYNNLVLRAPNTFDDSNKAFIFAEQREAHQKQIILGQYRKNQPLYSLLRNNFADYRNLKQGFSREDGRLSPKSLSTSFKPKRTFQKPTFPSKFCDAKLPLATTRNKKGLQSKAKEPGFSWFCDAGAKGSSTFASDPYTNRRFDASEAGTGKKGKQDTFFLQGVTKQSFVTPGFSNQGSNGPGFSNQKGEVFLQKSGLRRIQGEASPHVRNSRRGKGTYEPWSFSKQLRGAFLNQSFFNFSRKNCKVFLSKTFLTSTKLTSAQKSQQKSSFPTSNLYAKSHKSSIKRQAKPNLRLKWSFVQRVIFDYGFYSSFVTKRLQNVDKKHTFAQEQAKKEALRDPYFNEGQIKKYDFVKGTTSRSLEKKREQNRADTNKDTPSSSLLSNFRNLAQATLEANRLQTSDLQRSLGEIPAEPRQTFYDKQNTVTGLAGTVLNRSAIGIQHTDYLRLRALSFLQNNAKANNGFEEKESPIANANGVSNELDFTTQKSNLLGKKKGLTNQNESPYTSKKGLVTDFTSAEADLDFLNQAIELAATESVEWRAFYIDQQLSENMGFLDDFLHARSGSEGTSGNRTQDQSSIGTYLKSMFHPSQSSDSHNQFGNVLYYKSLCRSKNLFSI